MNDSYNISRIIKVSTYFICLQCCFTIHGKDIEIHYDHGLVRSFTNDREQEYKNWSESQLIISDNQHNFSAKKLKLKQKQFEESIENTPYGIKYVIIDRDSIGNIIRKTTMDYNNLNKNSDSKQQYNSNMYNKRNKSN